MTRTPCDAGDESKESRMRLADSLADQFDERQSQAYALARATDWTPTDRRCAHPDLAARLFTAPHGGYPRLRLSIQGSDDSGFRLVATLKAADDRDAGWETIPLTRGLLAAAGRLLTSAAA